MNPYRDRAQAARIQGLIDRRDILRRKPGDPRTKQMLRDIETELADVDGAPDQLGLPMTPAESGP